MVSCQHTPHQHTLQPCSDVSELLKATYFVDLNPLVDVLSPPDRGRGRRLTHLLAKVKVFLISHYPGSILPEKDAPLAELLADPGVGLSELFGFAPGASPHRTRLHDAFNRLERHPDLLADATCALSTALRDRPWEPVSGVVFEPSITVALAFGSIGS